MDVRPIRDEADYAWALAAIESYFQDAPDVGSPDADRFDVLTELIGAYEDQHCPTPDIDPIDLIRFAMTDMGRSQAELAELLGSRPRASEILSRKRPLTIEAIRKISDAWKLPAELLIRPYATKAA